MWACGVYDLGLTSDQFWDLTPAQFEALLDRKDSADHRCDWRSAMVASVVANGYRDPAKKSEPWQPRDFMPSEAPASKDMTAEDLFKHMKYVVEPSLVEKKRMG